MSLMKNGKKKIKWVKPSLKEIYIQHNEKAGLDCTNGSAGGGNCSSGGFTLAGPCTDGTAASGCNTVGSTASTRCTTGGTGPP